jgi:hypothetical protein
MMMGIYLRQVARAALWGATVHVSSCGVAIADQPPYADCYSIKKSTTEIKTVFLAAAPIGPDHMRRLENFFRRERVAGRPLPETLHILKWTISKSRFFMLPPNSKPDLPPRYTVIFPEVPCPATCRGWIVQDAPEPRFKGDVIQAGEGVMLPFKYRKFIAYEPDDRPVMDWGPLNQRTYSDGVVVLDDSEQYILTIKDQWLRTMAQQPDWRSIGTTILMYPKWGTTFEQVRGTEFYWGCVAAILAPDEPWGAIE